MEKREEQEGPNGTKLTAGQSARDSMTDSKTPLRTVGAKDTARTGPKDKADGWKEIQRERSMNKDDGGNGELKAGSRREKVEREAVKGRVLRAKVAA